MMTMSEFRWDELAGVIDGNRVADEYYKYFREAVAVGDGVTVCLWSDRHAYTVIGKTPYTLKLRRCKATLKESYKPEFIPGGFSAICVNNSAQEYDYEEDPDGEIVTAYWSKKRNRYYVNGRQVVTQGRHEFYDYNF